MVQTSEDTEVVTVYFGGGTTNLYLPRQYEPLMTLVRETVPRVAPDLEVTVEGIAQPLHAPRGAAAPARPPVPRGLRDGVRALMPGLSGPSRITGFGRGVEWPYLEFAGLAGSRSDGSRGCACPALLDL